MIKWLLNKLNPTSDYLLKLKQEEVKIDLLNAEESLEYWEAMTPMLRKRNKRLNPEQSVDLPMIHLATTRKAN
jgi:hypothetical protein